MNRKNYVYLYFNIRSFSNTNREIINLTKTHYYYLFKRKKNNSYTIYLSFFFFLLLFFFQWYLQMKVNKKSLSCILFFSQFLYLMTLKKWSPPNTSSPLRIKEGAKKIVTLFTLLLSSSLEGTLLTTSSQLLPIPQSSL